MVTTSRMFETAVSKGQDFTIADLRAFLAAADDAGAANTTVIRAEVRMGGKLRKLSATAIRFGDNPTGLAGARGLV